jgi:hypothetical protein
MLRSQPEITQVGMMRRPWAGAIPMVFSFGFPDRQIIDAGMPMEHQAILVEFPVLVAVGPEPVAGIIAVLIGERAPRYGCR